MGTKSRTFIDGEILFREGEAGESGFVIKRGQVALSKETNRGPVEIEVLGKGEFFGEIGVLNGGKRTLTAIAVGDLLVDVVGRKNFKSKTPESPAQGKPAASRPTPSIGPSSDASAPPAPQSWFSRLFAKRGRDTGNIEVRIVPLIGEKGDRHARNLLAALSERDGLSVRMTSAEGAFQHKVLSKNGIIACARESHDVLRKSGGDMLIWGDVSPDQKVLHLHFTSAVPTDEDLPGSFNDYDVLPVPIDFSTEWAAFLYATVLTATAPFSAAKAKLLTMNMETAIEEGAPIAQKPPRGFSNMDRANLIVCLGHTLAVAGQRLDAKELLQLAGETYSRALGSMPEEEQGLHRGMVQKNLGCVLAMTTERTRDASQQRTAADAMRAAIEMIPRQTLPREWATAQNRLGQTLYRLHMADSAADSSLLSEAITAFRAAVQVYTRVEAPERWADVMNSYAQATQVLGGQMHDPVVLQRAVNACRSALEVRRRDRTPFLWATTQNTLGSALFLMAKITNRIDHLEAALDAFHAAHEIYASNGAVKMARVIARNLEHVRSLLAEYHASGAYHTGRSEDDQMPEEFDENWWRENVVDDDSRRAFG